MVGTIKSQPHIRIDLYSDSKHHGHCDILSTFTLNHIQVTVQRWANNTFKKTNAINVANFEDGFWACNYCHQAGHPERYRPFKPLFVPQKKNLGDDPRSYPGLLRGRTLIWARPLNGGSRVASGYEQDQVCPKSQAAPICESLVPGGRICPGRGAVSVAPADVLRATCSKGSKCHCRFGRERQERLASVVFFGPFGLDV